MILEGQRGVPLSLSPLMTQTSRPASTQPLTSSSMVAPETALSPDRGVTTLVWYSVRHTLFS